jgi:hypothetical protein
MFGGGIIVNELVLCVEELEVVRVIFPEVARKGTVAVICVAELTVKLAVVALNFTKVTLDKFPPKIVTVDPLGPLKGAISSIRGKTVK